MAALQLAAVPLPPMEAAAQSSDVTVHPTAESLALPVDIVVPRQLSTPKSAALRELADRLRSLRTVRQVGVEDGAESEVIGTVEAATLDGKGRLLVLDRAFQNVRLYESSTGSATLIGRKGNGPLDLRSAFSIWPVGSSSFAVADGVLGVKIVSAPARDSVRLERLLPSVGISGGCGAGGSIAVIRTPSTEVPPVQVFDETGRPLRSLGTPYRTTSSLARLILSEGVVGCLGDGRVAYALSHLPFVHLHSADGSRRWTARFSGFSQGYQEEKLYGKRRGIGLREDTKEFSLVTRIIGAGSRLYIVQVAHQNLASLRLRKDFARLDTYAFDADSGEGVFVSSTINPIGAVRGDSVVTFSNDPFPQAFVMRGGR